MVKIGYKVLLAADVWTYTPRGLTKFTGTPRSDLVGADESIYTRLDKKVSDIEAFDKAIPVTPVSGTWGEKFKPFSDPKEIIIPMYLRAHERAYLTHTDPGTAWFTLNNQRISIDFTEIKVKRVGAIVIIAGTEAGTKGVRLYNLSDGVTIASATWAGTAAVILGLFGDVTLTGVKVLSIDAYASSPTEDIKFLETTLVLIRKDA